MITNYFGAAGIIIKMQSVKTYKNPEKNLKTSSGKKEGASEEDMVEMAHKKRVVIMVLRRPHTSPTAPHSRALLANPLHAHAIHENSCSCFFQFAIYTNKYR